MAPKKIKGRYEIRGVLGEGGMGVVYRAFDPPPMSREVAVKTLLEFPDRMSLQLFYKECEVLKSMSHPNIIEIFDIGEFDDGGVKKPFFVMPLLPGQALDALIRGGSHRLTVERVVDIISQTCRGLQAAHERGLIHRDLKPSNIFVMQDDSVKIIDFGVARVVDARTRSTGFQKGTLLYMAPEQIQFKPVSAQSDIFSLGVVCYEALTRRQPFRGTSEEEITAAILKTIPPPASEINPAVNPLISRVVHKAMAKQPWHRFDNAREFGEALQKSLRNEPIEIFDPARIQPRIQRAAKALDNGDYQFAGEIVGELEAEGNIDPQLTLLRTQIDQVVRQRKIAQLLESARARYEEEEDPLALQKIQEILEIDPNNVSALGLKSRIDDRRSDRQIEKWLRLARQHVDNNAYGHAREALQNVLQLRANEPRALRLTSEVETREKEYLRIRQQKAEVYQNALNSWKNGEVSEALAQMGLVLELDRQSPDAVSPDTSKTYQTFYDKLRSEHDAIGNAYAEARRALAERQFAKALKTCQEALAKYPNQALFQALKFDVEEQQRQQLSAFIAETDRKLEGEADLDVKVSILREALAGFPGEQYFERSLRLVSDKRDLVNSIVARSRAHEERGQITEAINALETLRNIYAPYPGLQFEVDRLHKRREKILRDTTRVRWVEQVDRQLQTGNHAAALDLLQKALVEFPGDPELVELEKMAREGHDRAAQAEQLLSQGQVFCQQGNFDEAIAAFRNANKLDPHNPLIRTALRDFLVDRARTTIESDWQSAEALADQALELDPNHALARSLRSQALDRRRDTEVAQLASRVRRLQTEGNLDSASAEVEKALSTYPSEPRLSGLRDTLNKEISRTRKEQSRSNDLEQARGLQQEAAVAPNTDQLSSIYERSRVYAQKYPEEPELQTIAREIERIVKTRAERPRTPRPVTPKQVTPKTKVSPRIPRESLGEKIKPLLKPPVFITAAVILILAVVGVMVKRLWPAHPKVSEVTAVHVQIRTVPPGAALKINGQDRGQSGATIDLQPGDYQVEASLAGYETISNPLTVKAGAPADLEITLQPLTPSLRITTPDLEDGQVFLDDNPVGDLESGTVALPNITAGAHTLRIATKRPGQEATVQFQIAPGSAPAVSSPLPTHQLQIIVVATNGSAAQVSSSVTGVPVLIDGQPSGDLGNDGLQIPGLSQGSHELVLGTGGSARKMSFETGASSGLDAMVFSDRDVGSILVLAGEDDAEVTLDGKVQKRKTQHGQLRIPGLRTANHTVHLHKDGFKDPVDQSVAVVKGQEAKLKFAFEKFPKLANLALEHLPRGAQVSLDDTGIGVVNDEGNLSHSNISPGPHTLSFAIPGYMPSKVERNFAPGETLRLSVTDLELKHAQAILDLTAGGNTAVTVTQNGRVIRQFTGSQKLTLDEGTYVVTHHSPGAPAASSTIILAAGESKSIDLRATNAGMERWQHPEEWKLDNGWYVHRGGGFVLYDSPSTLGAYDFAVRTPHGRKLFSHNARIEWVVAFSNAKNYVDIQLDNKYLYRADVVEGARHEFPKVEHHIPENESVTMRLEVSPGTLKHLYSTSNGQWNLIDSWEPDKTPSQFVGKMRNFTDGKFGFNIPADHEIQVSNFSFYANTK